MAAEDRGREAAFLMLCDGCHYEIADCVCDEIAAERAAEYGPICGACGGAADDGYENCEYGGSDVYEAGPGGPDSYGCPLLTGTF